MVTYTEPKQASNVPIIDLTGTFEDDAVARGRAAEALRTACRDTGFFYVANHGIEQSLVDAMFEQSKAFFAQPASAKEKLHKRRGTNGYEPLESQGLDPDSPVDLKESYNLSKPGIPGTPDHLENLWPDELPGFKRTMQDYHAEIQKLALHLSRLLALSLDLPFHFFDETFDNQRAALRILRYPPMPKEVKQNQLGAGAHTDWGWITIVAQDDNGGLEVETAAGDWIKVDPIPGAFVVNLGDLVPEWTNGLYHSSLHRVLNKKPDVDRYSTVLFFNHRYETIVETLPTCLKSGEKPREPFVSGDHRKQKAEASRKHLAAAS